MPAADPDPAERRSRLCSDLLIRHGPPVVTVALNLPLGCPEDPAFDAVFREALAEVRRRGLQTLESWSDPSARRWAGAVRAPGSPAALKRLLVRLEERHPLGRLWDLDVVGADGAPLDRAAVGAPPRSCFLCDRPALVCRRTGAHQRPELAGFVGALARGWGARRAALPGFLDRLTEAAAHAITLEAAATPKPGLVDARGPGAHEDMTLPLLLASGATLVPWLRSFAAEGAARALRGLAEPSALFRRLRRRGERAERAMFARTGGVNTHKGLLFSMGLLAGAAGALAGRGDRLEPAAVCALAGTMAAGLVERELAPLTPEVATTAGERTFVRHGSPGARGEAAAGFPAVLEVALPELERSAGLGEERAAVRALLALMAAVDDGNLLARGGPEGLAAVQAAARAALGSEAAFASLDRLCRERRLSPGGCADLLAAALFLRRLASR